MESEVLIYMLKWVVVLMTIPTLYYLTPEHVKQKLDKVIERMVSRC